jgi:type I restriction enzyme, S subunit
VTLESLLAQVDVMVEAPGGVQQLRKLILQLAVQGKLVTQDPADEPAGVLMARMLRQRAAEVATRDAGKLTSPVPEEEYPHEVPLGWEWWPFASVARIASNLVDPRGCESEAHIAPDSIEKGTGRLLGYRTVGEDNVRSSKHRFSAGQLLYSKIRPALSKATIVDFGGLCSADMYPLDVYIDTRYLLVYMLSATFLGIAVRSDTRVAMPKINQAELSQIPVPVPPLAEQRRIAAKVDELMALCDELEARLTRARDRAAHLAAAVVNRVTAA